MTRARARLQVLHHINRLQVARPCDAPEAQLSDRQHGWWCGKCERRVYDFAAMEPREIASTYLREGGRVCARIVRRADGSIVHQPERPAVGTTSVLVALSLGASVGTAGAEPPAARYEDLLSAASQPKLADEPAQMAEQAAPFIPPTPYPPEQQFTEAVYGEIRITPLFAEDDRPAAVLLGYAVYLGVLGTLSALLWLAGVTLGAAARLLARAAAELVLRLRSTLF